MTLTLERSISPPLRKRQRISRDEDETHNKSVINPATVEAGLVEVRDHLQYFTLELSKAQRPVVPSMPRLAINHFVDLYKRNDNDQGHHFVIHQHDHPVAGVHYDLRLQISKNSSVSWSIPYGLPGNPNSKRPNRMAIETRIHNLWNHLIESASHATGSLLIWDTGEYEVLPRPQEEQASPETDDEEVVSTQVESNGDSRLGLNEPLKLKKAFQDRHIHLRLHGTRLPKGYSIALRISSQDNTSPAINHSSKPRTTTRRQRRRRPSTNQPMSSGSDDSGDDSAAMSNKANSSPLTPQGDPSVLMAASNASDEEGVDDAQELAQIRNNNAYPGAINSIGSIHQRKWFLSLDKTSSGFFKVKTLNGTRWTRLDSDQQNKPNGFEYFYVLGRDVETSVITGRTAGLVMQDAGVEQYKGRKMWRAIKE